MFLVATKVAIVESLRSVWFSGNQDNHNLNPLLDANDEPVPRRITVEYPEEAEDWPAILIQIRPTLVEWTGITPDEIVDAANFNPDIDYSTSQDPAAPEAPVYKSIRQGRFEGSCMLQVLATESQSRDKMWDNLIKLLLMGQKRPATANFYTTLENHDLVGITVMKGSVRPIGDTISLGTPWDPELLTYEAAIEFDMTGVFYADEYNEDLIPLKTARVYEYIPLAGEEPPGENDNNGVWQSWAY